MVSTLTTEPSVCFLEATVPFLNGSLTMLGSYENSSKRKEKGWLL